MLEKEPNHLENPLEQKPKPQPFGVLGFGV